ncbi:hypothetical protein [Bacteroides acidifaciens]|uniref:hypothetical protein n=1 Tax=Bacteroides acidifaciens TaxID=85831 RepID=UPI0027151155|nr:hypothetical protein [Bacteroides acidifaciens]
MMNNVPTAIQNAAKGLTDMYGQNFAYLGQYQGRAAWRYCFPEDTDTGYPFVYLYADGHVDEITGREALRIISLFVKD